jgi:hypothetical protein
LGRRGLRDLVNKNTKPILFRKEWVFYWDAEMMLRTASFAIALLMLGQLPVWAASKSHTVTTSCVIAPVVQISSGQSTENRQDVAHRTYPVLKGHSKPRPELGLNAASHGLVEPWSNLAGRHQLHEKTVQSDGKTFKIFSLTAL